LRTSHPVSDEGAFILGHALGSGAELIVRILTHRPLQENSTLTGPLGEFIDEEHLMT